MVLGNVFFEETLTQSGGQNPVTFQYLFYMILKVLGFCPPDCEI